MVRPVLHSFPDRGSPSTSHARVRWQPYHASAPTRSSPLAYFVTPASSTASVYPSPSSFSEPDHTHHPPREHKLRQVQKSKFALSLVDQAVKSLCDIWPQQDIPAVFLASACLQLQKSDTIPIKGFIHEVLRRSRTSGTVLQTALCYLEAIRPKVPDLVRKEKQAFLSSFPLESASDRISKGAVGIDYAAELSYPTPSSNTPPSNDLLATVRIDSSPDEADASFTTEPTLDADKMSAGKLKTSIGPLPPLPPLPSPLLCPRRTFLAALILAAKFIQDRCYSNRAWGRLSGLPPREIGRCERALGEALEWRLWVGKLPAAQYTSGRPLTKSRSENDINLSGTPSAACTASDIEFCGVIPPASLKASSIRRRATVPPGCLLLDGPRVVRSDILSPTAYSASPSTPGLSYSPTPTDSSAGDRTVQMTTYMDVSTPPPGQFAAFTGAQNDKALGTLPVPSSGLFVHPSSQEMGLVLSRRIDSHCLVSHDIAPQTVYVFTGET